MPKIVLLSKHNNIPDLGAMMYSVRVVHEENRFIIVEKPHNLPTQADQSGDDNLLDIVKSYLRQSKAGKKEPFCGMVHRLDRPTGGLVVFAKTAKAAAKLSRSFRDGKVKKEYAALVHGVPLRRTALLTHFLLKDRLKNVTRAFARPGEGRKESILEYELVGGDGEVSLLRVMPQTGRSHQIRVQLAAIGNPIVGDVKYGAPMPLEDSSIRLFAYALTFVPPSGRGPVRFVATPPDSWPIWFRGSH